MDFRNFARFIITLIVVFRRAECRNCPEGFYASVGKCYKLVQIEEDLSNETIQKTCAAHNSTIVTIYSDKMRGIVEELVNQQKKTPNICVIEKVDDKLFGKNKQCRYLENIKMPVLGFDGGTSIMTDALQLGDVVHMKLRLGSNKMDTIEVSQDMLTNGRSTNVIFQLVFFNNYKDPSNKTAVINKVAFRYGYLKRKNDTYDYSKFHHHEMEDPMFPKNGRTFSVKIKLDKKPEIETDLFPNTSISFPHDLSIWKVSHFLTLYNKNLEILDIFFTRSTGEKRIIPTDQQDPNLVINCNWRMATAIVPVKKSVGHPNYVSCQMLDDVDVPEEITTTTTTTTRRPIPSTSEDLEITSTQAVIENPSSIIWDYCDYWVASMVLVFSFVMSIVLFLQCLVL